MNTFISILLLTTGYYFIINSVVNKDSKDKIFNITFITIVFLFLSVLIGFIKITFINVILYFFYLLLSHGFYTDFLLFDQINEYFIKKSKGVPSDEVSIKGVLFNIIIKELNNIKKELLNIITAKSIALDIILITYGLLAGIAYLLHYLEIIDLFKIISKLT